MRTSLNAIRNRPRFKLYTQISRTEYAERLRYFLEKSDELGGNINKEVASIWVKTEYDSFWKPYLSLRTEKDREQDSTVIRGVFGPSASVWTFFMFLYILFATAAIIFFSLWFVTGNIATEDFSWAKYAAVLSLFMLGVTYVAAFVGQRKAKEQMKLLRKFAERSTLPLEDSSISSE